MTILHTSARPAGSFDSLPSSTTRMPAVPLTRAEELPALEGWVRYARGKKAHYFFRAADGMYVSFCQRLAFRLCPSFARCLFGRCVDCERRLAHEVRS